jgi:hypothetical protein
MVPPLADGTMGVWETDGEKYDRFAEETIPWAPDGKNMYVSNPSRLMNFRLNQLKFSEPTRMAYGGFKVDITFAGEPLVFQTPVMRSPFGLTVYNNKRGVSKVLELEFYHKRAVNDIHKFFDICRALDYAILNECIKNRATWMPGMKRSHYNDADMWKRYCGITRKRETKGGQVYDPRFTVKVWGNKSVMFDRVTPGVTPEGAEETIPITPETIPKKSWMVVQAACTGLWISKDSMSPGFRLTQGRLAEPQVKEGTSLEEEGKQDKPTSTLVL